MVGMQRFRPGSQASVDGNAPIGRLYVILWVHASSYASWVGTRQQQNEMKS